MKKLYTLLLLSILLLPAAAKADIFPTWVWSYNGSVEIYSDAAYTNKVIADYSSEDGVEMDIDSSMFPDGLYIKTTPFDGYILGSLDVTGTEYADKMVDNKCHIAIEDLYDPTDGLYIMAWFEEPRTLTLISNGNGTLKAYKEVELINEIPSGTQLTDTDFSYGVCVQIIPDEGYTLQSLIVNDEDATADVIDDIYIIYNYYDDVTLSATFESSVAGIDSIETDSSVNATETFDLKGNRVNSANTPAGLYIIRQGDKTIKILKK